jgi:hypothetical protein
MRESQVCIEGDIVRFLQNTEGLREPLEDRVTLLQEMRDADALDDIVKFGGLSRLINMNRRHAYLLID